MPVWLIGPPNLLSWRGGRPELKHFVTRWRRHRILPHTGHALWLHATVQYLKLIVTFIIIISNYKCPASSIHFPSARCVSAANVVCRDTDTPIAVAARSGTWTVFARSNTGIVGSNPSRGMNVCARLFCVCVVLCVGSGLVTGWSSVQGDLPTVYRFTKLKKRPRSNKGL
jgi:hypothetical protein